MYPITLLLDIRDEIQEKLDINHFHDTIIIKWQKRTIKLTKCLLYAKI